jgi:hypothetical protein
MRATSPPGFGLLPGSGAARGWRRIGRGRGEYTAVRLRLLLVVAASAAVDPTVRIDWSRGQSWLDLPVVR